MAFVPITVPTLNASRQTTLVNKARACPASHSLPRSSFLSQQHAMPVTMPSLAAVSNVRSVRSVPTATTAATEEIVIQPTDPENVTAQKLSAFYSADAAKMDRIVTQVRFTSTPTKPRFPPTVVADLPRVPIGSVEAFKADHIDSTYIKWGTPEAEERLKRTRKIQFDRWDWAVDNIAEYVNVLRVADFSDEAIQNMIDGTPLCFPSIASYTKLRKALGTLRDEVEAEMGWTNVGFIITGSSVPGFSQNPCKGLELRPTRITSPTGSDVDICIVGGGVNNTMLARKAKGEREPLGLFDTTCTRTTMATRYGCKDMASVCKASDAFWHVWSEKLDGGLQITFGEDDSAIPPWESRIDVSNF